MMLSIKPAEQSNFKGWCQLYRQYLEFYKTTLSNEQLSNLWHWFFQDDKKIYCYLAILEEKIIGLVHFREFLRPIKASIGVFMDDLFVAPEYRGEGVAQKLIYSVEQFSAQRNVSTIRWITASDNHAALNLYEKLAHKTQWVTYDMAVGEKLKV